MLISVRSLIKAQNLKALTSNIIKCTSSIHLASIFFPHWEYFLEYGLKSQQFDQNSKHKITLKRSKLTHKFYSLNLFLSLLITTTYSHIWDQSNFINSVNHQSPTLRNTVTFIKIPIFFSFKLNKDSSKMTDNERNKHSKVIKNNNHTKKEKEKEKAKNPTFMKQKI